MLTRTKARANEDKTQGENHATTPGPYGFEGFCVFGGLRVSKNTLLKPSKIRFRREQSEQGKNLSQATHTARAARHGKKKQKIQSQHPAFQKSPLSDSESILAFRLLPWRF